MAKPGAPKNYAIREQIRELAAEGLTNRQIAVKLDYSTQRIWELRKEIESEQTPEKEAVGQ